MEHLRISLCPVCGDPPRLVTTDLGRPGGHGYPGHYMYRYECEYCKLLKAGDADDVYRNKEEAIQKAKLLWNEEAARIQNFIDQQYIRRNST